MLEPLYQTAPFLRRHLISLVLAGSHGYGMATETSDIDLRGIAYPPPEAVFGLQTYEQTTLAEPDTVIYSLPKFVRLAMKGNPTLLEMLFAETEHWLICTEEGERLRAHRHLFLSKRVFYSFGGYAYKHLQKLSAQADNPSASYHGKDASHLIRLLQCGIELLQEGALRVKRENAAELLSIRQGQWKLTDLLAYAQSLYDQLQAAHANTRLPDQPDSATIERLLMQMQMRFYLERGDEPTAT
nr:nucleotidyltransferase domain-containing protein [Brevibacillus fulvus]